MQRHRQSRFAILPPLREKVEQEGVAVAALMLSTAALLRRLTGRASATRMRAHGLAIAILAALLGLSVAGAFAQSTDLSIVPFWDGETSATPDGPLINRFGGPVIDHGGTKTSVQLTTSTVHSGTGAFEIDTLGAISAGSFGFFQTALSGFGPSSAYVMTRDVSRFDETRFWLKNTTGSSFTLKFEIKDYRDSGSNMAYRTYTIPADANWRMESVPLNLNQPGWTVVGNPDLTQTRFLGFVIDANQGQAVNGALYLDDMAFVEPGGPVSIQTAPLNTLVDRLAQRQFDGLWGSRNRTNGLIPSNSVYADVGALNTTSAVLKMLPGAVGRGWVPKEDADAYVAQLVGTLNTVMNNSVYLPPRYMDWVTLAPKGIREESSVDAAFMALALHQYKSLSTTSLALRTSIDGLENRFNFAAFSSATGPTPGWKLAYQNNTGTFTAGTYDGYSGEPWLISLAAQLSQSHHVPIRQQFNSGVLRELAFLVDPANAHLVHTSPDFRAPFLQWLLPLFVDVSQRGVDSFPNPALAGNAYQNAVLYQQEVDAKLANLGRGLFLQPDAGDDGSGSLYEQFSAYKDFGRPDLYMPWSVAFSLLGDPAAADAALRNLLAANLDGPLGLTDSARWVTGAAAPYQVAARNDFWNTALSTMALIEYLYGDSSFLSSLPEVEAALDQVYFPLVMGDVNNDTVVNIFDINLVSHYWGTDGSSGGDANLDGMVNIFDVNVISANWGATSGGAAVPEPSSLALAALTFFGLIVRACRNRRN